MRVAVDTNILISAVVFGGQPEILIQHAAQLHLRLILSPPILEEFRRVLQEKFEFSDAAVYRAETLLRRVSRMVETAGKSISVIREDPSDNRVPEAVVAGRADIIVSGDKHLLRLASFRGIPILTVRQALDSLEESTRSL